MQPPCITPRENWPPDYTAVYMWRVQQKARIESDAALRYGAIEYYRSHPKEFILHWIDTYDPRNAHDEYLPTYMPLILFPAQGELIDFLHGCVTDQENGLIEKCRDMGATWVAAAYSVWMWRFWPGAAIGWGSRKVELVDRLGDPDSIFEKMRIIINRLPSFFYPEGFNPQTHMPHLKIINPEHGSIIAGEGGTNIGRGGRKLIYFKDEAAHYEQAEAIEAALADNTRVQIDISSVNGSGNVFHRRRQAGVVWRAGSKIPKGKTRVFVMDWRDHPAKTQEWYDTRKAKAAEEGLLHVFAQEVDRNYSASIEGIMIQPEWIAAAVDAHKVLGIVEGGKWGAALDVADGGPDRNALALRQGVILRSVEEWSERDTAATARKAVSLVGGHGQLIVQYDCIGVGAGVKAEINNLSDARILPRSITFQPWNAAASPLNPEKPVNPSDQDSPKNGDYYANIKAQGWRELSMRFYRTYRAIKEGATYDPSTLISIDSTMPRLEQLKLELSQAVGKQGTKMKLVVDKTPGATKSPNMADAVVMAYWPVEKAYYSLEGLAG